MYSPELVEHFTNPTHNGTLESPDILLEAGNSVCGDQLKIYLETDGELIRVARFQAWGCAASIAAGNALCDWLENQSSTSALKSDSDELAGLLGELRPEQTHVVDLMHSLITKLESEDHYGG